MTIVLNTSASERLAFTGTAADIVTDMDRGELYAFLASTGCYIAQGAAPTASAADGSMFVPANTVVHLHGSHGPVLSVVQHTTGGVATLTPVVRL